ncbi:MAG: phosphatase PAP2 family protein [Muribaculaceae bacterium]|nr:phosphatase PAP2 family protein [Muribaculaceae bacterium]
MTEQETPINISETESPAPVVAEERTMGTLDLSTEIDPEQSVSDPERGPVVDSVEPRWARIVSAVFSPILVPTYSMILALWLTDLSTLPESVRLGAATVVFLITGIAPMIAILTLIKLGYVDEFDIPARHQRYFPTVIMVLCFLGAAWYIYRAMAPVWLVMLFVAGAVSSLLLLAMNTRTKVSGHSLAMGTMLGMMIYIGAHGLSDVWITPWIVVVILLAGLVGSARLALDRHTPLQVALGMITGIVVTYFIMGLELFHRLLPKISPLVQP